MRQKFAPAFTFTAFRHSFLSLIKNILYLYCSKKKGNSNRFYDTMGIQFDSVLEPYEEYGELRLQCLATPKRAEIRHRVMDLRNPLYCAKCFPFIREPRLFCVSSVARPRVFQPYFVWFHKQVNCKDR